MNKGPINRGRAMGYRLIPVTLTFESTRQEDFHVLEANLGYVVKF